MLWFFHAGDAKYDPVYGMHRRETLVRANALRPSERTDWLLSAELALIGPIIHVRERLANRRRSYPVGIDRAAFRRRLDPVRGEALKTSPSRFPHLAALRPAVTADLDEEQLRRCDAHCAGSGSRRRPAAPALEPQTCATVRYRDHGAQAPGGRRSLIRRRWISRSS